MNSYARKTMNVLHAAFLTRRGLLILAGSVAFCYAVIVLLYVQSIPDIGLRTAFSPEIKRQTHPYDGPTLEEGDTVTMVGDIAINTWADLLNSPFYLRNRLQEADAAFPWAI